MNGILTIVRTATSILALYNEAQRAGLIEYLKD